MPALLIMLVVNSLPFRYFAMDISVRFTLPAAFLYWLRSTTTSVIKLVVFHQPSNEGTNPVVLWPRGSHTTLRLASCP